MLEIGMTEMKEELMAFLLDKLKGDKSDTLSRWASPFMWGAPGVGKTDMCRGLQQEVSAALGTDVTLMTLIASQLDPVDWRGIPWQVEQNGEQRTDWLPPTFLPSGDVPTIMFLDELPQAPVESRRPLFGALLGQELGGWKVPANTAFIAAGNPAEWAPNTEPMETPLLSRFAHYSVQSPTADEWISWAHESDIYPAIVGYVSLHRDQLYSMRPDATEQDVGSTPRSLEFLSTRLRHMADDGNVNRAAAAHCGPTWADRFHIWHTKLIEVSEPEAYLDGSAKLSTDLGTMTLEVTSVSLHVMSTLVRSQSAPKGQIPLIKSYTDFLHSNMQERRELARASLVMALPKKFRPMAMGMAGYANLMGSQEGLA